MFASAKTASATLSPFKSPIAKPSVSAGSGEVPAKLPPPLLRTVPDLAVNCELERNAKSSLPSPLKSPGLMSVMLSHWRSVDCAAPSVPSP